VTRKDGVAGLDTRVSVPLSVPRDAISNQPRDVSKRRISRSGLSQGPVM